MHIDEKQCTFTVVCCEYSRTLLPWSWYILWIYN